MILEQRHFRFLCAFIHRFLAASQIRWNIAGTQECVAIGLYCPWCQTDVGDEGGHSLEVPVVYFTNRPAHDRLTTDRVSSRPAGCQSGVGRQSVGSKGCWL